jgi:hypothetical protein
MGRKKLDRAVLYMRVPKELLEELRKLVEEAIKSKTL